MSKIKIPACQTPLLGAHAQGLLGTVPALPFLLSRLSSFWLLTYLETLIVKTLVNNLKSIVIQDDSILIAFAKTISK